MSAATETLISTEPDYQNTLGRTNECLAINPEPYSDVDDKWDVISTLVPAHEQALYALHPPDPSDAILPYA